MKYVLFSVTMFSALAHAATPFLIFSGDAAYTDSATIPVAQKYLLPQDYLGYEAVVRTPQLRGIVEATHQVSIAATVEGLRRSFDTIASRPDRASSTISCPMFPRSRPANPPTSSRILPPFPR